MTEHRLDGDFLRKLNVIRHDDGAVEYRIAGDHAASLPPLNAVVGKRLALTFTGHIACCYCGRAVKKTYSQGYCYPCSQQLARCDMCIVKPHLCHFDRGTCREPDWGRQHCMQPHLVYLAYTSAIKVGITRIANVPTRWIDQGAIAALPCVVVHSRKAAGELEVLLAQHFADRTDWRGMLRGNNNDPAAINDTLLAARERVHALLAEQPLVADATFRTDAPLTFCYPLPTPPTTVRALTLDNTPQIDAVLRGVKGQYLIFDDFVCNMRKHTGYQIDWTLHTPSAGGTHRRT